MENSKWESKSEEAEINDLLAILELQQDGIAILDQKNNIRYINQIAVRLLNLSAGTCEGQAFPFQLPHDLPVEEAIATEPARYLRMISHITTWKGEKSSFVLIREISESKREEKRLHVAATAAETRAMELEALKFVADQLNQVVLRDDTVQAALETALSLFETQMAWVLLPGDEGTCQMYAAYRAPAAVASEKRNLHAGFKCPGLDEVFSGDLVDPCMINLGECMAEIGFPPSMPVVNCSIPLVLNGKPLGLLNLVPLQERELEFADFQALKTIGQQFTIAIQRALPASLKLAQTPYYAAADLTSRALVDELDLAAVSKNVLKLAVELTGAEAGSLGLLNSNRTKLSFQANIPDNNSPQVYMRSDDLLWDVVDNGNTYLLHNESIAGQLPMFFSPGASSMVLTPVCAGSRILGLMVLYTISEGKTLNDFNKSIALSLGRQAGNAVQNAYLFMEVQQLAVTDTLTGLYNQKSFITQAVREMERTWRYKRPLSIISIVIDDIRSINESYGREIGDRVMQVLGQICAESLRKVDIIGRYTGNNFVILLPETDAEGARDVAERLRQKTENWRMGTSEGSVNFTISLGISGLADSEVIDLERFIDRANQALYTALQAGGNRALVWEPEKKKR